MNDTLRDDNAALIAIIMNEDLQPRDRLERVRVRLLAASPSAPAGEAEGQQAPVQPAGAEDQAVYEAIAQNYFKDTPQPAPQSAVSDEQILSCMGDKQPARTSERHGAAIFEYRLFELIRFARAVLALATPQPAPQSAVTDEVESGK